jgi:hypothetical protein
MHGQCPDSEDGTGRRVDGLARGGDAAEELLATLSDPGAPSPVRWTSTRPAAPQGRLTVYDEPPLGDIADFVAASATGYAPRCRRCWPAWTAAASRRRSATARWSWTAATR